MLRCGSCRGQVVTVRLGGLPDHQASSFPITFRHCPFLCFLQGAALYTDFSVFPYTQEYPAGLAHKAAAVARREAASDAPA